MTEEMIITESNLSSLTSESEINIVVGDNTYVFNPISLKIYTMYETIKETDEVKSKSYLISECSTDEDMTEEQAADMPIGLSIILLNHLMRASFLMPPVSTL